MAEYQLDRMARPISEMSDVEVEIEHTLLQEDKEGPFVNADHPLHQRAIERMKELLPRKYPPPSYPGREELSGSARNSFDHLAEAHGPGFDPKEFLKKASRSRYEAELERLQFRLSKQEGVIGRENTLKMKALLDTWHGGPLDWEIVRESGLSDDFVQQLADASDMLRNRGAIVPGGNK